MILSGNANALMIADVEDRNGLNMIESYVESYGVEKSEMFGRAMRRDIRKKSAQGIHQTFRSVKESIAAISDALLLNGMRPQHKTS